MKKIISLVFIVFILSVTFFLWQRKQTDIKVVIDVSQTPNNQVVESKIKIIAVGDSLTAGYGLNLNESYPVQLEKKLIENLYNVTVINAGISGETTAGLLDRTNFINSQNPEIILFTIGGNDALRNLPISETEKNITKIIQKFKTKIDSKKIFLLQIQAPGNLGPEYTSKFNKMYRVIAKQEDVVLVPFVESEVFTNSQLMQQDGIHPNAQGYKILVDKYVYEAVIKVLQN